jgi:hypothetical protein
MSHKKGEICDVLEDAKMVNTTRNKALDCCYYVAYNTVFKKLKNGKFRELVKQESRPEYKHYFFRDKDTKKKLTLNANKLDILTYVDPTPEETESLKETLETPD